ncbi:MAG: chemotaxis protein CheW [Nitrospirae bacterium]|nr:chemotaxis protein CheW [Nitrospirota bacterium]MBF0534788.1 chemotaxis protein CheW [Nitrospirota bacterium]MBF0616462.1 chemotaxis protein CheW [Nitrospirota bacterium]
MTEEAFLIPYIAFRCGRFVYAVDTLHVREIIHLPEFKPVDEAPEYVAGLINVRGNVIPLIDIDKRFGRKGHKFALTDKVIVFSHNRRRIGVIVDEIMDIYDVSSDSIEKAPLYSDDIMHRSGFIEHVAKINENILMILSHHKLFDSRVMAVISNYQGREVLAEELFPSEGQSPGTPTETAAIFHKRAVALAHKNNQQKDSSSLMPVAVVELEDELFGIELTVVREFVTVNDYRQVPCCPSHVIGNINLRGEIVTLIDIRDTLGMTKSSGRAMDSAVIVVIDNFTLGICIESLRDVLYVPVSEQKELPIAIKHANESFFKCTALFDNKAIVVLNLQNVLYRGSLIVNDIL